MSLPETNKVRLSVMKHENKQIKNLPAGWCFLDAVASDKISKKANMHKYESMSVEKRHYQKQTK